jgi:hypothetical protein
MNQPWSTFAALAEEIISSNLNGSSTETNVLSSNTTACNNSSEISNKRNALLKRSVTSCILFPSN